MERACKLTSEFRQQVDRSLAFQHSDCFSCISGFENGETEIVKCISGKGAHVVAFLDNQDAWEMSPPTEVGVSTEKAAKLH